MLPAALYALCAAALGPAALATAAFASAGPARAVQQQEVQPPAPIERRSPPAVSAASDSNTYPAIQGTVRQRPAPSRLPRGEHLAQWMSQHSSLTPDQQQQALGREPGFTNLPSETQQRYRDRLTQLNAMNPGQRERVLANTEWMERLAPEQRAEVRSAMGQLGALPIDERRVVARTFRSLRDLRSDERLSALNSGRFGPPLVGEQRSVILGLLRVEPLLPPPPARPQAPAPFGAPTAPGSSYVPPVYQAPR